MSKQERVIIGETERAGLPISAPLNPDNTLATLRWRNMGASFVLEQYIIPVQGSGRWVEVPCVKGDS